jgi:Cytochrome bd terminal oxidase subunit II
MIALWYGILVFMLTTYIVLDGRNFGAGILHWIVARNQAERRQVIAAIGPLWSWHEVWLVGTGGVMVMAFPRLMAASFSGCYLALFLILWCVLLRGISIEVGGHLSDRLWQEFWDSVFVFSNVLLAVLFGAALGNVARGVPLTAEGTFYLPFFTNFNIYGNVARLVHCPDGAFLCPYLNRPWSHLPDHENRRSSARTIGRTDSQPLACGDPSLFLNYATHLVCASRAVARNCVSTSCVVNTSYLRG